MVAVKEEPTRTWHDGPSAATQNPTSPKVGANFKFEAGAAAPQAPPQGPGALKVTRGVAVARPAQQPVVLSVDGPYGSASEEVFGFRTLVLVGAGIGVTPFASIMKSIKLQYALARAQVQGMRNGDRRAAPAGGLQPPMVYFYWVCRDMQEFNSFKGLMLELADSQDKELSRAFRSTVHHGRDGPVQVRQRRAVESENYNVLGPRTGKV